MEFLIDLKFVFINLFILIIWFRTEAFIEYFKHVKPLKHLLKIDEYLEFRIRQEVIYPDFLVIKYNNFFTKLMSCPKCLNFWITLFLVYFIIFKINFFFIYFVSLFLYNIYVKLDKYE